MGILLARFEKKIRTMLTKEQRKSEIVRRSPDIDSAMGVRHKTPSSDKRCLDQGTPFEEPSNAVSGTRNRLAMAVIGFQNARSCCQARSGFSGLGFTA